mmetsp:Transcript_1168/g.2778  ORF Transcript_1168/g.2778 Transcript_1168/m.2778 type:complete len:209 (-) Transcript_1168:506-1132(-)
MTGATRSVSRTMAMYRSSRATLKSWLHEETTKTVSRFAAMSCFFRVFRPGALRWIFDFRFRIVWIRSGRSRASATNPPGLSPFGSSSSSLPSPPSRMMSPPTASGTSSTRIQSPATTTFSGLSLTIFWPLERGMSRSIPPGPSTWMLLLRTSVMRTGIRDRCCLSPSLPRSSCSAKCGPHPSDSRSECAVAASVVFVPVDIAVSVASS